MLTFDAESHIYRIDGEIVPSVTGIIKPLYDFSAVPPEVLAKAGAFGTAAHTMCVLDLAGQLEYGNLDEGLLPLLDAFTRWRGDYPDIANIIEAGGDYNPETGTLTGEGFAIEKPLGDKKRKVAGTPDLVIDTTNLRYIIDIKTREPNKLTDGIQCSGYDLLHAANGGSKGKYEHRVLYLKRDGTYQFVRVDHRDNPGRFRFLLDHYNNQQIIQSWKGSK